MTFKDEEYDVQVQVSSDGGDAPRLHVTVERLSDGAAWRASFTAACALPSAILLLGAPTLTPCVAPRRADLEEMTAKSGSLKRLAVLASMLRAALRGESATVSLDLLTGADLEALKSRRKTGGGAPAPSAEALWAARASAEGKRYLIVTYAAEFDRVHYPLPLPPADARRRTSLRGGSGTPGESGGALRAENAALRAELAAARRGSTPQPRISASRPRETGGSAAARLEATEAELERLAAAHAALRSRSAAEVAALSAELATRREAERSWRLKARDLRAEVESLQRRLRATEARVGLRGGASSANFTYSRPGSRPSSTGPPSRPLSPYVSPYSASAYAASSRGASPAPSPRRTPARPPPPPRPRSAGPGAPSPLPQRPPFLAGGSRTGSPAPAGWRSPAAPASPRWRPGGAPAPGFSPGRSLPRAESPGAALRDVKARLAAFNRGASGGAATAGRAPSPSATRRAPSPAAGRRPATAGASAEDASAQAIAEIDARLHALQDFLRAAKTGSAAA